MFNNSGSKIKVLALVNFWLGTISSVICGIVTIGSFGLLIIPAGIFVSWLSSIVVYGIGEGIENTDSLISSVHRMQADINHLNRKVDELKKKDESGEKEPEEAYKESVEKVNGKVADGGAKENENLGSPGKKLNVDFSGSEASSTHTWRCIKCGQRISTLPCPFCENK